MVGAVAQHKDVVMEHTLFKCKRRLVYVDAIREVSDEPIELYLMWPSEELLKSNIQKRDGDREDNDYFFEQMKNIQKHEVEVVDWAE